jgi:TPR repeat
MLNLWHRMFGRKRSGPQRGVVRTRGSAMTGQFSPPQLTRHSPTHACREEIPPGEALCPVCCNPDTGRADAPEWFAVLQAHVTAVQANDMAVRLFREGRLDAAIAELRRGLEANPRYATGHSNLGFLYLRQAAFEQAVESLLRALEVDPNHQDAPDHLCDVLLVLIDELAHIGLTEGFLATQPGRKFDEYNRHIRTRDIGVLIAKIGKRGVFKADGRPLETDLLMELVINAVRQKMGSRNTWVNLRYAWQGIRGWQPSSGEIFAALSQWRVPTGVPHGPFPLSQWARLYPHFWVGGARDA